MKKELHQSWHWGCRQFCCCPRRAAGAVQGKKKAEQRPRRREKLRGSLKVGKKPYQRKREALPTR